MTTGTVNITDSTQDQTRVLTVSGMTGATGTSPSFTLGPADNVTLQLVGTFGSGTWLLNGSNDGGATFVPLKDLFNAAVSITTTAMVLMGNYPPLLNFTWSGATSPNITANVCFSKKYY